jgi:RNA polymerase sigma factor (sigma-70 family)
MDAKAAEDPKLLAHYEGLVRKTAARWNSLIEDDFDDVCQFLRFKVWKALLSADIARLKQKALTSKYTWVQLRDRYVFSCIANAVKDLLKKKKHNLLFIEDIAPTNLTDGGAGHWGGYSATMRDSFEQRYLSTNGEVFSGVEDECVLIPSTLSKLEKDVLLLMYLDFKPAEIAEQTHVPKKEVSATMKTIREKMADWAPEGTSATPIAA